MKEALLRVAHLHLHLHNNGPLRNWSYRNNLLIYRGSGSLVAIESGANNPIDFTHNAWYPDGPFWWSASGGSFSSLGAARLGLPATTPVFGTSTARHQFDVILVSEPFVNAVTLGQDHLTEIVATTVPTLRPGVSAKASGTPIPNITDGYSGAAPDMGAVMDGRPMPRWGAVR